ncbi:helix-turn-helix domain-containing protein [Bacillus sp. FJAT-22090]|uniref:helix-turn-helix domain-containing protein n=1 Tax=Bacillus sp. FJAT-22090 TaxID=1581038 RepID=UPI00119F3893|nr:helix-turn-helix transcriptional regulator [Bacillus sp. FJAT-22090]
MYLNDYYQITSSEFNLLKNSTIGERIRFIRHKLMDNINPGNFTTSAISERTGIAAQTITTIERGESKKPSFGVIHALAKEFKLPMEVFTDDFYEGEEKLLILGNKREAVETGLDFDEIDDLNVEDDDLTDFWNIVEPDERKIVIRVTDETEVNQPINLYEVKKMYREELDIIRMISNLIQDIELDPKNLSIKEFEEALKRSPLKEAKDIVNNSNRI